MKRLYLLISFLSFITFIYAQTYVEPLNQAYLSNGPVKIDKDGFALYSGNKPAYIQDSRGPKISERFFAGELDNEDHDLVYGHYASIYDYRVHESLGNFSSDFPGQVELGYSFIYNLYGDDLDGLCFIRTNKQQYYCKFNTKVELRRLLEAAKKNISSEMEVPFLPHPLQPKYYTYSKYLRDKQANQYKPNSSSSNTAKIGILITIGAALGIMGALTADDNSSSSSSSSKASTPTERYEYKNVEIVNWATYNWLAAAHAEVELRNKNNYDVIVNVSLYQGSWSEGRIIYTDLTKGDRIPGVSDEQSTDIRVKANSIRRVCLRADHSGRPTHIRISSVR